VRGKPKNTPENFSGVFGGNVSDKVASSVGFSRPTLSKIKAAKQNPQRYQPLVEEMDHTNGSRRGR